jgi:hypothetical protein
MAKQQKLIKEIPNLWRPEFIPFYPDEVDKYKLNDKEGLVYGFVRHFLKNCSSRFFFTNEQLRYVLGTKINRDGTISNIVKNLVKKCPEIITTYQIKKDGGKIRIIGYVGTKADLRQTATRTYAKPQVIENTLNNTYKNKESSTLKELFEREIQIIDNTSFEQKEIFKKRRVEFLEYWTAKNSGDLKENWQTRKKFYIKLRWSQWNRRADKWQAEREENIKNKFIKKDADRGTRIGGFSGVGDVIKSRQN